MNSAQTPYTRRHFLRAGAALSGAGILPAVQAATPGIETTKIRFVHAPSICIAPLYIAEQILRADGFTEVQYLPLGTRSGPYALAEGRADFSMWDTPGLIPHLDAGRPISLLAGVHAGCYELFGHPSVRAVRDLKGKTIAVQFNEGGDYILLASMLAYVGMQPQRDVHWVWGENAQDAINIFAGGKADAFLAFGQQAEELRQRKIGHILIDTSQDRPWSQYFCCMVAGNRDFVQRHPVTAKRVVRAILMAADVCSSDPLKAARFLADKLYEPRFQIGYNVMKRLPYNRWREANPEDTLRFHALRLHEAGMIKSTPRKLISDSTDWRFLDELKKELKA